MKTPRGLSLRGRFIFIVLGGAVLPLALLGIWLARTAERSGEELLTARLDSSLGQVIDEIGLRWLSRRSELLVLAESGALQAALSEQAANGGGAGDEAARRELERLCAEIWDDVESVLVIDAGGSERFRLAAEDASRSAAGIADPALPVGLGIFDLASGARLGTLKSQVRMSSLLPSGAGWGGVSGSLLAAFDPASGTPLLPLSIDPALFARERFVWRDEPWITVSHRLHEPPLSLVLAAPVAPFSVPFEEAARRNVWILGIVAICVIGLAVLLIRGTTAELMRLATAAEAVSRGELDRKVEEAGSDEVGRLARAFNVMTESLRRTLRELSQRQALAAVGEFAASLAHEVRNPLTSIRLDLQRVEEQLPDDEKAHELLSRALGEIARVDRSVTGALRVARSGSVILEPVDIHQPLHAALNAAGPELEAHDATFNVRYLDAGPVWVKGDASALEQLFLNLLLNAAQSLDDGGRVEVTVSRQRGRISVSIEDTGCGIPLDSLERVGDPFYSTRSEGTGLGLAIAQRIAVAHGGELELESTPGAGTTARLRLPRFVPDGESA